MAQDTEINVEIDRDVSVKNAENAPDSLVRAVRTAFEDSIGHIVDSREIVFHDPAEHESARFSFSYMEYPEGPGKWLPPYRTREKVNAELRETLPDGYTFELANNTTTGIYSE